MKPRQSSGLLDRQVQQRDARLFVIAVEGEASGEEFRYFTALQQLEVVDPRRVKLLPLAASSEEHDSAPEHVLERLDRHAARFPLRSLDQCWLALDLDTWKDRSLSFVCQEAAQRRYGVALSNPCFEIWLLLHFITEQEVCTAACAASAAWPPPCRAVDAAPSCTAG